MATDRQPPATAELPPGFEQWSRDRQASHIAEHRYRAGLIEEMLFLAEFEGVDPDQIHSDMTLSKDMLGTVVASLRTAHRAPNDASRVPGKPADWLDWPLTARGQYLADRHTRGELAAIALRLSGWPIESIDDDRTLTTNMLATIYCELRGYQFSSEVTDNGDR